MQSNFKTEIGLEGKVCCCKHGWQYSPDGRDCDKCLIEYKEQMQKKENGIRPNILITRSDDIAAYNIFLKHRIRFHKGTANSDDSIEKLEAKFKSFQR